MDRSELAQRLMATFIDELAEHVAAMNRDLLALEKNPTEEQRAELLHSVFRAIHSLKGGSRAVNVPIIEQSCHAVEDLLVSIRNGQRTLTPDVFALLYRAADAFEEAGMRLREEQDIEDGPLARLLPEIKSFIAAGEIAASEGGEPDAAATADSVNEHVEMDSTPPLDDEAVNLEPPAREHIQSIDSQARDAPVAPGRPVKSKRKVKATASVRIKAEKLDALLAQAGELLVARQRIELGVTELETLRESVSGWRRAWRSVALMINRRSQTPGENLEVTLSGSALSTLAENADRIGQLEREIDRLVTGARGNVQYLGQKSAAIENDVHNARMVPFIEACEGLERAIRDVAANADKQVRLALVGTDVQVDRSVLEGVKEPLLHLVRNAVDHGIETTAARTAAGKPQEATITVQAALRGAIVEICVRDDGGGIDLKRVAATAAARGMKVAHDPIALARTIFEPAFSTASRVTDVSGRGVGLDVVRSEIEQLHGSVEVSFEAGAGTCFTLNLPLTLTTVRAVMVQASGQYFAIPTGSIDRVVRFDNSMHTTVGNRSMLLTAAAPIALTGLSTLLGLKEKWELSVDSKMLAIILVSGGQRIAVAVDEIAAEVELTVKSLGERVRLRHVSGAALLPSGDIALVLNIANLIRSGNESRDRIAVAKGSKKQQSEPAKNRILVVDDSSTSRMLLRSILDASGYAVSVAVDGQQALEMVKSSPFELVVSDVDMPRLNGFEFTAEVRKTLTGGELPVILITARSTEEDRARGIQAGANAYIVKSGFDQTELLQLISDLI